MQTKAVLLVCLALGAASLWGQAPPPTPAPQAGQTAPPATAPQAGRTTPTSPLPPVEKPYPYIRRFSIGASLSVMGLKMFKGATSNIVTTTPAVDTLYTTTDASQRIGYGLTAQAVVNNHFAVHLGFLVRKIGYKMDADILKGTTTITQIQEHEDTRARLYDIPVTVRYYVTSRFRPGPHFFFEGGGTLRNVRSIRTSISQTTISDTTSSTVTTCCTTTPATPAHRSIRGFVGGMGIQFIDPVGVRVIPQVRYTRWMDATFNQFSTHTQRNQVEAMISLAF